VGAISGKIALVNNGTALSGEGLGASGVVDFVGYGSASSCEGFAPGSCTATVSGLTNTLAALRNSAGCIDTDNNASDFSTGSPNPRYAISPANICSP
jgi:hypothetical protein